MFKTIRFKTFHRTSAGFAYAIFRNTLCVFTALDDANQGSSINWAENIAYEIAKQEGRQVMDLRFFDLQTHVSYGSGLAGLGINRFEFHEVMLVQADGLIGIRADGWSLVACPKEVRDAFSAFVDEAEEQFVPRAFEAVF